MGHLPTFHKSASLEPRVSVLSVARIATVITFWGLQMQSKCPRSDRGTLRSHQTCTVFKIVSISAKLALIRLPPSTGFRKVRFCQVRVTLADL